MKIFNAFFIVCFSTLPTYAQPNQTAIINFELTISNFHTSSYSAPSGLNDFIQIELQNKYVPDQKTKKLRLLIGQHYYSEPPDSLRKVLAINRKHLLRENIDKWLLAEQNGIECKFSSENWDLDTCYIVFAKQGNEIIASLYGLQLPPSKYHLSAKLNPNTEQEIIISDTDKEFIAGISYSIPIKRLSIFETLKKELVTTNNLFIATIVGLISILIGVLKDKIKNGLEWILDGLGKYSHGKLAERRFLKRFLENIIFNHKYLKLIGFNTAGISRPQLEEVFVSLRVSSQDFHQNPTEGFLDEKQTVEASSVPFATALKHHKKMVILGGPGAGKTTTLSFALLMFAQNRAKEKFAIEENLIPIFIPLRRLLSNGHSILDDITDEKSQLISDDVLKECPQKYFERKLKAGRCIVLLDGLDEVTDERAHREVAEKINNMIADYPNNRYVVTCRIAGWKNLLSDFKILETQDFSRDEIQRFIHGWHRAIITQSEKSKLELNYPDKEKFSEKWRIHNEKVVKPAIDQQSRKLIGAIDSNNRILAIAVNPMLLSLISLVHLNRSILPKGRPILYKQCIEFLIDAWDRTRDITSALEITSSQKEAVLRKIAFEFQRNGKGEDTRENLEKLIEKITPGIGITIPAKQLLTDIENRSGLLIERSINVLGFSHLTLQEYLAAEHIQLNPDQYDLLLKNFDNQEWREVILLYSGLIDDATRLIQKIVAIDSLDRFILGGYCVGDSRQNDRSVSEKIIERLLFELNANAERREDLLKVLSAIAADFKDEAITVEQKLSQKLINALKNDDNTLNPISAIAITGKSRLTCALPVLVGLAGSKNDAIRDESIKALIAFGNLALPYLEKHIEHIDRNAELGDLYPLIDVLSGINTGLSAKLLLKLYDFNDNEVDTRVSLELAYMLKNPFIESDLMEMEDSDLAYGLRNIETDGNGWFYSNITTLKSAFSAIDHQLRNDIGIILLDYELGKKATSLYQTLLKRCSFKILLPCLLTNIKQSRSRSTSLDLFKELGFDTLDDNRERILYLSKQINKNPSLSLKFVLQNIHFDSALADYPFEEKRMGIKWLKRISNVYFVLFYLYLLIFQIWVSYNKYLDSDISNVVRYFDPGYVSHPGVKYIYLFMPISIMFYIALTVFTKIRTRKKILSESILGILFCVFPNFLRVLPYVTKVNIFVKLVFFEFLVILFSFIGGYIIDVGLIMAFTNTEVSIVFWPSYLPFCLLSVLYMKLIVLKENTIYQLMLLHPDGRKIIGIG